jgi:hypothetical protein
MARRSATDTGEVDPTYYRFMKFDDRLSHWGDPNHRPLIPNHATVLPPDLPDDALRLLLIRMELEEAFFKLNNLDREAESAAWLENTVDVPSSDGNVFEATKARGRVALRYDIRALIHRFDAELPPIIPPGGCIDPELD